MKPVRKQIIGDTLKAVRWIGWGTNKLKQLNKLGQPYLSRSYRLTADVLITLVVNPIIDTIRIQIIKPPDIESILFSLGHYGGLTPVLKFGQVKDDVLTWTQLISKLERLEDNPPPSSYYLINRYPNEVPCAIQSDISHRKHVISSQSSSLQFNYNPFGDAYKYTPDYLLGNSYFEPVFLRIDFLYYQWNTGWNTVWGGNEGTVDLEEPNPIISTYKGISSPASLLPIGTWADFKNPYTDVITTTFLDMTTNYVVENPEDPSFYWRYVYGYNVRHHVYPRIDPVHAQLINTAKPLDSTIGSNWKVSLQGRPIDMYGQLSPYIILGTTIIPFSTNNFTMLGENWYVLSDFGYPVVMNRHYIYEHWYYPTNEYDIHDWVMTKDDLLIEMALRLDPYGLELFHQRINESTSAPYGYVVYRIKATSVDTQTLHPKLRFDLPSVEVETAETQIELGSFAAPEGQPAEVTEETLQIYRITNPTTMAMTSVGVFRIIKFNLKRTNDQQYNILNVDYNDTKYCLVYEKIMTTDNEVWRFSDWSATRSYKDWHVEVARDITYTLHAIYGIIKDVNYTKVDLADPLISHEQFIKHRALVGTDVRLPFIVDESIQQQGKLVNDISCQIDKDGKLWVSYLRQNIDLNYQSSYQMHYEPKYFQTDIPGFQYQAEDPHESIKPDISLIERVFTTVQDAEVIHYVEALPKHSPPVLSFVLEDNEEERYSDAKMQYRIAAFNSVGTTLFASQKEIEVPKDKNLRIIITNEEDEIGEEWQPEGYLILRTRLDENGQPAGLSGRWVDGKMGSILDTHFILSSTDQGNFSLIDGYVNPPKWQESDVRLIFNKTAVGVKNKIKEEVAI